MFVFAVLIFKSARLVLLGGQGHNANAGASSNVVHGSLMVALEHPSGSVRARAVEQLSRALSTTSSTDAGEKLPSASAAGAGGDDLPPALLRRLHDEDPEVVLAITDSDVILHQVLLSPSVAGDGEQNGVDAPGAVLSETRATNVASAIATAAVPWLSAMSEARPKHPVASSGRVLCGLVRLMAAAASCVRIGEHGSEISRRVRDLAFCLFLECLPGPHMTFRVKMAQQQVSASVSGSGFCPPEDATAGSTAVGKSCKKAFRAVGRAAIEAVSGLCGAEADDGILRLFACICMLEDDEGKHKGSGQKSSDVDKMQVDCGRGKSKGLKVLGQEVCDTIAASLVNESTTSELQVRNGTGLGVVGIQ